ncbi:MAG: amidohydrolase family protein [Actinomycetota bacterium]|jgi:imidazolonepropionase-like amidohydrolase|nr:amidohydrolase family protein [Euzebyaceae bacterium]MDQ3452512.1 amidohydrolase family protein [Actinomycetota bacterium]
MPTEQTAPPGKPTDRPPSGSVALSGGQAFLDGRFAPATVIIDGDRIGAVGPDIEVPGGLQRLDCTALWLIPGFIDTHVHVQFSAPDAILAGGVTTVRDLGSPPSQGLALAAGPSPLRVVAAGRILTPVGGYPTTSWGSDSTGREVRDAEDAVDAVREQATGGACIIKVALEPAAGPVFDEGLLRAVVEAAHAEDLAVTAHVGSAPLLELAIATGVDELAHLPLHDVTETEMAGAAEAGMVLVPTLEIRGSDPNALRAVAAFREADGTVVYGTDLGNGGTAPGIETTELRAMLGTGMAAAEVLEAATATAADHLGLDDVGRLRIGASADIVALGADPLQDPAGYDDVRLVMARGRRVLDRL